MRKIVVFIYLGGNFIPAGLWGFENQGRFSHSVFRYGEQYLQRDDAISIDPIQLPLSHKEFKTPPGFEVFNGIRDAGPDRWGRYLLEKKFSRSLDEMDYLLAGTNDRSGALAFGDDAAQSPKLLTPRGLLKMPHKRLDLKVCAQAIQEATLGEDDQALQLYLDYGPSLGGARPKTTVLWNNKPHIAKFTLSMDKRNESLIEYATMLLAQQCGLNVPNIDVAKIAGRDVYLIERFDRAFDAHGKEYPIPFVSGLTMTGLHEQDYPQWSYLALCNAIEQYSSTPLEDKRELFKRIIFNILVFNNDDHMRNHGFLYQGQQKWGLSPLYDVVPGNIHSETYMLALNIGDQGKTASLANALSAAPYFHIAAAEAKALATEMLGNVRTWESHYRACGVKDADIEKLRNAFRSKL